MAMHRLAAFLLMTLAAIPAAAQFIPYPVPYDKVLLPVVMADPEPGLLGSMWVTRLTVTNNSADSVSVVPFLPPGGGCTCFYPKLRPGVTASLDVPRERAPSRGVFLFIERPRVTDVDIDLRAQDLTREHDTWGTTLPIVRDSAFRRTAFSLIDLPTAEAFRVTVRFYTLDPSKNAEVNVKLFAIDPGPNHAEPSDVLLGQKTFTISAQPGVGANSSFFPHPGYSELTSLDAIAPSPFSKARVRLLITPVNGDAIWAFATVTHNDTQHVTVIEPGR